MQRSSLIVPFILALGILVGGVRPAAADPAVAVRVMVLGLSKEPPPQVDPALRQETRIVRSLENFGFKRVKLQSDVRAQLNAGQSTSVPIRRRSGARTKLTVRMLGPAPGGGTRLALTCPGIGDLELEAVHKGKAPLLVVAAKEGLAVAIRKTR
jgi:hypothetical protein